MAYRLCTFDASGRITSVSPESYDDTAETVISYVARNPILYSLIDESLLPAGEVIDTATSNSGEYELISDGIDVRVKTYGNRSAQYDPRTEVVLFMPNPAPFIAHGTGIIQDVTKVGVVYNLADPTTKPIHSTAVYKFGPASGKFTKSSTGYTGGFLYLTNLSKRTQSTYTAPHNNIGGGATLSYSVELFFYPTSTASNFTLLQKGPTGASANWKLGFDSSAGQLQFAWQSYGSSGGYNYTQNIINTAGLTTNTWHHVAVAMVKNGSGICYQMSGYFNGVNKFSQSVTLGTMPEVRYNHGLYVGNNSLGTESFDGYIDSFRFLESPSTGGFFGPTGYGFLPFGGGTLGVPTLSGFTRSAETCAILNFNNRPNTSDFYVESLDFISGTVTRITDLILGLGVTGATATEVGVKDVVRYTIGYTAGATGYSDPTGFTTSYGSICAPFLDTAVGNTGVHGYDSAFELYGVYDNNPSLNVYRVNYRNDLLYDFGLEMMTTIEGICGNRGSSGSIFSPQFGQNPFRRLFSGATGASGNCYGVALAHNSLFLNPLDTTTINYIMNNGYLVTQGISSGSYSFVDARGLTRNLTATDISNLRLDVLEYQTNLLNAYRSTKTQINTAATVNEIKYAKKNKTYNVIGFGADILGPKDSGGGLSEA